MWTYSTLHPILPCQGRAFLTPPMASYYPLFFSALHTSAHRLYSLLAPAQLLEANYFLLSFFPCHIHFSISSFQLCFVLFPLSSVFSPSTTLHLLSAFPQLLADLSLFAWQSVKDADSVSRASRALPCPSRPGLRFVMLDNTLQCRDKTSATAHKKSLVFFPFFPPFPFHRLLHFWRCRFLRGFSFSRDRNKDCREGKMIVPVWVWCMASMQGIFLFNFHCSARRWDQAGSRCQ